MNVTDFVNKNYNIVFKGKDVDKNNLEDVKEFLLTDIHDSSGHTILNCHFISKYAKKNDMVLIEAIPSMEQIQPDDTFSSVWLKTKAKIVGWDMGTLSEITGKSTSQKLSELERKGNILQRQLLDNNYEGDKVKLLIELEKIEKKYSESRTEVFLAIIASIPIIKETLPERTKAMQNSLDKARNISDRRFLIAGMNHLKEDCSLFNYSLDGFREFLKLRKVVVLSPKDDVVETMTDERSSQLEKIKDKIIKEMLTSFPSWSDIIKQYPYFNKTKDSQN